MIELVEVKEGRISEIEGRSTEFTQCEQWEENRLKQRTVSGNYKKTKELFHIHVLKFPKRV